MIISQSRPIKKITSLIRLLFYLLLAFHAVAQAQFNTAIDNGKVIITKYTGRGGTVTIPETIQGLPVTSIAFAAFSGSHDLSSITIPKSITNIGNVAFSACINLQAIDVDALNPVYSSVDGVLLNKSQTVLIECPGGKSGYKIPSTVTNIQDNAFSESYNLTSIAIPDSVITIEWHAFMSCVALTNVMIGRGVADIGDDAGWLTFKGCSKLMAITVDGQNPVFSSADGVLFKKIKNQISLIKYPEDKTGNYIVPDNVTKIESHAFSGSAHLTSVTIPNSVTSIEESAFENCFDLASVTIGNNVKSIEKSAFLSCRSLTSVTIPDSVTSIGDSAFYDCTGLTNVSIGKNVKSIKTAGFTDISGVVLNQQLKKLSVPIISISEPVNNTLINAMCVDVRGTFSAKNLEQITVGSSQANMAMPATINGNKFEARNIFLQSGTNMISAIAEDMNGNRGTNTITIMGPTDTNTAQTLPVQVQASTSGGFVPLAVVLNVQAHVPGEIQKVFYDFNGDNIYDQTNSNLQPVSHTYNTSGEFFPVVTIQTSVGRFSSLSGMMAMFATMFGGGGGLSYVNVQMPPVLLSTIKITDPVDVKWTATSNLYVLSGSTAAITEFDSNGKIIRSIKGIGSNPSGLAVDAAGNIYVAVTRNNQVWKFKSTANSFDVDTSFGSGGFIGNKDGSAGSNSNQFNAPFDVTVSGDGQTIIVSDSGNGRVQHFSSNGKFASSSSDEGSRFNAPKGLARDELGIYLFVVDSGNNRIVLNEDFMSIGSSGTNGAALGQFNGALHLSANKRALYVADTGNNRVQIFSHVEGGEMHSPVPFNPRIALSGELGLNHPKSVAAVDDFLQEKFYIADTGNNRVILVKLPLDNPEAVWKDLIARLKVGDASGAAADFSIESKDKYQQAFSSLSKDDLASSAKDMENIKPATIESDHAQYYFESVVEGHTLTFPVEFDKEFGQWKIMEY